MYLEIIVVLLVIGLMFFIVLSRLRNKQDLQSENIKHGLTLFTHIQKIISLSQQHRGTSNAALQGNDALKVKLISVQAELDKLIVEGSELNLAEFEQWQSFSEHWPRLKARSIKGDVESQILIRQHNMMVDGQLSILDDIVSRYGLNILKLDDWSHTSSLCLDVLRVVETIAQARGLGSGACARGLCSGADKISLNFLKTSLSKATTELITEMESIDNSDLSEGFSSTSELLKSDVDNLVHAIAMQVVGDNEITISASDYFNIATKPIEHLLDIFDVVILYSSQPYTNKA